MGTGSTRRRQQQRSRYNAPVTAQTFSPNINNFDSTTYETPYDQWHDQQVGMTPQEKYRQWHEAAVSQRTGTPNVRPLGPGQGVQDTAWDPQRGIFGPQGFRIPNVARLPNGDPVGTPPPFSLSGRHAPNGAGKPPPQGESQLEQWTRMFNEMYGDPTAGIRDAYGAAEGGVNRAYGQRIGALGNEAAAATAGVRAEGENLQRQYTALGQDATAQMNKYGNAIAATYAEGNRSLAASTKAADASLRANGVNPSGLAEVNAESRGELAAGKAADTGLTNRYKQLLGQEINDRKATGNTITTGNIDEIARILQQSKATAGENRDAAIAKLEVNMGDALASAGMQKQKDKFDFFIEQIKAGQTAAKAAAKTNTPSQQKAAIANAKAGTFDPSGVYKDYIAKIPADTTGVLDIQDTQRVAAGWAQKILQSPKPNKTANNIIAWFAAQPADWQKSHAPLGGYAQGLLGYIGQYMQTKEKLKPGSTADWQ